MASFSQLHAIDPPGMIHKDRQLSALQMMGVPMGYPRCVVWCGAHFWVPREWSNFSNMPRKNQLNWIYAQVVDPISKFWFRFRILNSEWKVELWMKSWTIGSIIYTYPIDLIHRRVTQNIILEFMNCLDYPCDTQKWVVGSPSVPVVRPYPPIFSVSFDEKHLPKPILCVLLWLVRWKLERNILT